MRILLLSQYFAPEPLDKVVDLARRLRDHGHAVQVMTGFPCYPQGKIYPGYRQRWYQEEEWEGIRVTRLPQFADHSRSVVRRVLYYLSFAISSATIGCFRARPADLVYVYQSALPLGFAGWILSRLQGCPLVLDVVDLWPESVAASGLLTFSWMLYLIQLAARWLYSLATHIIVITEGYRQRLLDLGVPPRKLDVIHCWPAAGQYESSQGEESFRQRWGLADRINVTYAGTIGPCQDLETLIRAAEELRDLPQVQFIIAGTGVDAERLQRIIRERSLSQVRLVGQWPAEDVAKLLASSDLLVIHLRQSAMSDVSIPSKTFAYMASGKPLLMAVAGEAAAIVHHHACGIVVPPSDARAMANAIRDFCALPQTAREAMGAAGRTAFLQHFSSEVQTAKVRRLFAQLVNRPGAEQLDSCDCEVPDNSVIMIGCGAHAKVVARSLMAAGRHIRGVYDDARTVASVPSLPVLGTLAALPGDDRIPAVIAIGNGAARRQVAEKIQLPWVTVVHPRAWVDPTVRIGEGTVIAAGAVVQTDCSLGRHVIINTSASVDHDCQIGDFSHIGPGVRLAGNVIVGEGCFLGTGCVVVPGVTIGAGTTIGAGSVVVRDIPGGVVAFGCPARVMRSQLLVQRAA